MELKMYVSGKITGLDPEACKLKFAAVEAKLKMMGVSTVINPLNIGIPDSWNWDEAMELCMRVLKKKQHALFSSGIGLKAKVQCGSIIMQGIMDTAFLMKTTPRRSRCL